MNAIAVHSTLALLLVLAPLARVSQADTPEPPGVILDVQAPVSWHPANSNTFQGAHGGETLLPGAVVRTGIRGFAHIHWRNGGDFKLYPLSELVVPEDEGVNLNTGSVWAKFSHKLLQPFYFKSPTATAVVRGTTLGVEIEPEGGTRVAVIEGHVEVSGVNTRGSVLLAPGEAITITSFGMLGPVGPVAPQDRSFSRDEFNGTRGSQPGGQAPPPPQDHQAPPPPPRSGMGWVHQYRASERLDQMRNQFQGPHDMGRQGRPLPPDGGYRHGPNPGDRTNNPFIGAPEAQDPDQGMPAGPPPNRDNRPVMPPQPVCMPSAGPICLPQGTLPPAPPPPEGGGGQ